jgi:hypothetical protein
MAFPFFDINFDRKIVSNGRASPMGLAMLRAAIPPEAGPVELPLLPFVPGHEGVDVAGGFSLKGVDHFHFSL